MNDFKFKVKLFWKRLWCKHDYDYIGEHNGYYTHVCKHCNKAVIQSKVQ